MNIDFHSPENRYTYASRAAHPDWAAAIRSVLDPVDIQVADVGCGGGIYSAAWLDIGAASVVGVDFSEEMVRAATERNGGPPNISFRQGDATATGLPSESRDIVFERALIHHLTDYTACFEEARGVVGQAGTTSSRTERPKTSRSPARPTTSAATSSSASRSCSTQSWADDQRRRASSTHCAPQASSRRKQPPCGRRERRTQESKSSRRTCSVASAARSCTTSPTANWPSSSRSSPSACPRTNRSSSVTAGRSGVPTSRTDRSKPNTRMVIRHAAGVVAARRDLSRYWSSHGDGAICTSLGAPSNDASYQQKLRSARPRPSCRTLAGSAVQIRSWRPVSSFGSGGAW